MPAGYSGTPLAKKLGVKEGHTVALVGAPRAWRIPDLDAGVKVDRGLRGSPDVILAFVRSRAELRESSTPLYTSLKENGSLWLVWPRRAGGHLSDVSEQSLRDELLPVGLVDTKVAALDHDWSGLRFVWRMEHRPSAAKRTGKAQRPVDRGDG